MRYLFLLLSLLLALSAGAQTPTDSPTIFLQVYQPNKGGIGWRLVDPAVTEANLRQLFATKLQQLGYGLITDRNEFRQTAPARYADLLYADVICHAAGGKPGVTLLVRDSIDNVLLMETEARSSYLLAGKAIIDHSRFQLRNRGLILPPVDAGPSFANVGGLSFPDYAYELYTDKPIRTLLEQRGLVLELLIDEVGLPTLTRIVSPADVDQGQAAMIGRVVQGLPRWRPAYADGRRVASSISVRLGRAAGSN